MKKFEYLILTEGSLNLAYSKIQELGTKGWELICVTHTNTLADRSFYFKREITPKYVDFGPG